MSPRAGDPPEPGPVAPDPGPVVEMVALAAERSTDPWVIRAVVLILGVVATESLGAAAWLAFNGHDVADIFQMASAGSLGALGALLASTSTRR